ncbi:MAG: cyclic pyranopterin phosphate synthase [Verrucomicrobiales bacterium]
MFLESGKGGIGHIKLSGPLEFPPRLETVARIMEDTYGHRISYLRVSITDRCNERCHYCMPEEVQEWLPRDGILSYEELLRVIRVGTGLGIHKVRITGGEPLTRRDVLSFFRAVHQLEGIDDIGVSTNGTLLATEPEESGVTMAQHLVNAGVRTANISLDTLDPEIYHQTTGRDYFDRVMKGIDAARAAGFEKIKINAVLMRDSNEDQLVPLVRFAQERELLLRFIELMPVSTQDVLKDDRFLATGKAKQVLEEAFGLLTPRPEYKTNGPASYYEVPDSSGQLIGFIGAMTNLHFCESCNKLRLTCDGKLRPCLGSYLEFDLKEVLRCPDVTDAEIADFFKHVVERKPKEHDFRNDYTPNRKMIAIGG